MEMRSGNEIPFLEEEKDERAPPLPKVETRASSLIPLLEEPFLEKLGGSRLPLCIEVFSHFFFLHKTAKMPMETAKRSAVKAATSFWELVSITPKSMSNGVQMLTRLIERHQANTFAF